MIKCKTVIRKPSGDKIEQDLTFLAPPRIGETILLPEPSSTNLFKAIVTGVLHRPATPEAAAELYLFLSVQGAG